jgi:hypothetical protein
MPRVLIFKSIFAQRSLQLFRLGLKVQQILGIESSKTTKDGNFEALSWRSLPWLRRIEISPLLDLVDMVEMQ